jgi:2-methylcitrate dehydratase PrpD
MVAGAREPVVPLVDRELAGADGRQLASLVPSGARRNAEDAALINGIAAHVLDYDDVTLDGHPSAVLVPAILAQAEASGASGAEMLCAYVAGYEVWTELLVREPVPLHQKGWHPTATCGTVAAAAACAKLCRIGGAKTSTALAIAASMASGLVANFGTLTKSFQVGRAAQSGLLAARLADAGLTAAPDALEHKSGFLVALSPDQPDLAKPFDAREKEWHLLRQGLNLKRYPVCYGAHRAIDAAIELAQRHDLKPEDIDHINVSTGAMQMLMLRNDQPQTGFEAKFSLPFAMAASVVTRNVGLAQMTDAFSRRCKPCSRVCPLRRRPNRCRARPSRRRKASKSAPNAATFSRANLSCTPRAASNGRSRVRNCGSGFPIAWAKACRMRARSAPSTCCRSSSVSMAPANCCRFNRSAAFRARARRDRRG